MGEEGVLLKQRQYPYVTAPITANGNYLVSDVSGINGSIYVLLNNLGTGTCTVNIDGSDDQNLWVGLGYYVIVTGHTTAGSVAAGNATLSRTVGSASITAAGVDGSVQKFQVLDGCNFLRVRVSSTAGSLDLIATVTGTPA